MVPAVQALPVDFASLRSGQALGSTWPRATSIGPVQAVTDVSRFKVPCSTKDKLSGTFSRLGNSENVEMTTVSRNALLFP